MLVRNHKIRTLTSLAGMALLAGQVAWAAQVPPEFSPQPRAKINSKTSSGRTVQLNPDNMDIYDFTKQVSDILGLTPVVIDPLVQGTVTFLSSNRMSMDEVFAVFNQILKSRSAALVQDQGIYQVVPMATALKNSLKIIDYLPEEPAAGAPAAALPAQPAPREPEDPYASKLATHVLRPEFVPVRDLLETVKLFGTDGGAIMYYERQNLLIVTDYADNVVRIRDIIRMLDKAYLDPDLVELVKIEYNSAVDIAEELKKIFGSGSGDTPNANSTAGGSGSSGISFTPLERRNEIFVVASTKRGLEEARRWIRNLDDNASTKYQTFIYPVQNSTAVSIAAMVAALFGGESSSSSSSGGSASYDGGGVIAGRNSRAGNGTSSTSGISSTSGSRSSSSSALSSSGGLSSLLSGGSYNSNRLGPQLNTASQSISSYTLGGGRFNALQDVVNLISDDTNNMLYIQATPADYRRIEQTIRKMDVSPRQVRIDAQVYEVTLNDNLAYGLRGELEALGVNNMTTSGISDKGLLSISTFAGIGNSRQITLALDALKTKTKVKVRNVPSVLTMDGQEASVNVGAEIPVLAGSAWNESANYTNVNYRKTGVTLLVVPRISASGSVTMELTQEVSSPLTDLISLGSEGQTPGFQVSAVSSVFYVPDGETVAIAGLIRDTDTFGRGGIPFLSDIPIVGGLFGATSKVKETTELIILITPHVIKTQDESQRATQELRDSLRHAGRFADKAEKERAEDIEDARKDREKQELSNIRKIKTPKK